MNQSDRIGDADKAGKGEMPRIAVPLAELGRHLAAVMSLDIIDYSRRMSVDEIGTHKAATASLRLCRDMMSQYGGRVANHRGDGMMAEFFSVVNSLKFAVDFQKRMEVGELAKTDIRFRIGVNLSDVLVEEGVIFGDGVNIAKRLEELASPGGICISQSVYEQVRNRVEYGFEFIGVPSLKGIVEPIEVYRVRPESMGAVLAPAIRQRSEPLDPPALPSIAVLPFVDLSQKADQGFLCDGIADDIITNLCRFRDLFVIARSSSFLYKGREIRVDQIGRELGVRYILTGSVRRAGQRAKISVQLIEAQSGRHLWVHDFQRDLTDVFAVQDEVTQIIAAHLAARMEVVERDRTRQAGTRNLEAYGLVLRGMESFFQYTKEGNHEARRYFEKAIDTDKRYARAYACLSRTYNFDWQYSWSTEPTDSFEKAFELAKKAIALDDSDARGFAQLGFVYLWRKQPERAIQEYERALSLNANDADVMAELADAHSYRGQLETAERLLLQAMRLNPFYPDWYLWYLGDVQYALRRYSQVIETIHQMRNPGEGHRLLAASYARLGQIDKARLHAAEVLRRQPTFSARQWAAIQPETDPKETEHFIEGMLLAGLPE